MQAVAPRLFIGSPSANLQPVAGSAKVKALKDLRAANTGDKQAMQKQKGFSLIELLIVVAIILIIAAIAIPNLLRARMAANESSAVSAIRTINTAEISYQSSFPTIGYAGTLASLGGATCATPPLSTAACLIDNVLATNNGGLGKSGYNFAAASSSGGSAYYASGVPITVGQTGNRSFCSDEDAVVRVNTAGGAVADRTACAALNPLQ
jgi:type IV pilus assembly protein PilA